MFSKEVPFICEEFIFVLTSYMHKENLILPEYKKKIESKLI